MTDHTHDRLYMHELMRREFEMRSKPTLFPLMRCDQPVTAERKRLEMQRIPWAIPPKRPKEDK